MTVVPINRVARVLKYSLWNPLVVDAVPILYLWVM